MGNTTPQYPGTFQLSDLDAAWLADTLQRNRVKFAGWRMEDTGAGGETGDGSGAGDGAGAGAGDGAGDGKQPPWGDPANFNPEEAWKTIQNLRREKGDPTKVADLEKQLTDLQTNQQAQLDAIAKAAGLKSDDTPPDPAKLAEQITAAQGETASEKTRADNAERKLAVFLVAGDHGANAVALLDSTSFLDSIKDVDHTDVAKLGESIKAAVAKDDRFKAAPLTPPFPGGVRKTTPSDPGPGLARLQHAYSQSSK